MTYEAYVEKMKTIGRDKQELDVLLDEAAEDPYISCLEYEALWYVWDLIMGGGDL